MLRVTLRGVQGHMLRFVLTALSVMLGVAFVAGTFVFTDSLDDTFDQHLRSGAKGLDVQVRGHETGRTSQAQGNQAVREQLPLSLADDAATGPWRRAASRRPPGQRARRRQGRHAGPQRRCTELRVPLPPDDPALTSCKGRAPAGSGEVALESSTLKQSGLAVGDRTEPSSAASRDR